jgi:hypothetical protein
MGLLRIVRRRRFRGARAGRIARPAGTVLLVLAAALCFAGGFILVRPLSTPAPVLMIGSRPAGARFYDRSGRLLGEAGSAREGESRWYALGRASDDCVAAAFLAARNLSEADILSADLLDVPRALAGFVLGTDNPGG